jgi:hypothetical protein
MPTVIVQAVLSALTLSTAAYWKPHTAIWRLPLTRNHKKGGKLPATVASTTKQLSHENQCSFTDREFTGLIHEISFRCNLKGPLTADEQFEFSQVLEVNPSQWFLLQHYSVIRSDVSRCIDEVGEIVQNEMDVLRMSEADNDKQEIDRFISTVLNFQLDIVVGVSKIVAERNSENKASDALPPVLSLDLYSMDTRLFTTPLQEQRLWLRQRLSDEKIERIDQQFRNPRFAVREEKVLAKL